MSRFNHRVPTKSFERTHQGGKASKTTPFEKLRRVACTALLGEDTFYLDGASIKDHILQLVGQCCPKDVAKLAMEIRNEHGLRHVPLWMCLGLVATNKRNFLIHVRKTVAEVVQRADEPGELLAMWFDYSQKEYGKRKNVPASLRRGIADALPKFNEYHLAKNDNNSARVKLRDVFRICRPAPGNREEEDLWRRAVKGELKTPDTWETQLSAGANKRETFERLITQKKLGALALIRNLRNMVQAGCHRPLIVGALDAMEPAKIFPYQFIKAWKAAPELESPIANAMVRQIKTMEKLGGKTVLLDDVSGSMFHGNDDDNCFNKASAITVCVAYLCEAMSVYTFSDKLVRIESGAINPMTLIRKIEYSQLHSGTRMASALQQLYDSGEQFDRIIIFTDEQTARDGGEPFLLAGKRGYIINVAPYIHGIGYRSGNTVTENVYGGFVHIHGFSEHVLRYIQEYEKIVQVAESKATLGGRTFTLDIE